MLDLQIDQWEVFPIIVPAPTSLKSINFFLVKHGNSLSLIDAGYNHDECWKALQHTLAENGFCLNDITEILLTHHHIDHIGLVNRIIAEHDIAIYASPLSIPRLKRDVNFLEMRAAFFAKLYQEMGSGEAGKRQVDFLKAAIKHNQQQALSGNIIGINENKLLNFSVLKTPGHSPDQLAFYDEARQWLFAGDLLINHISSNALVEPDFAGKRIQSLSHHINSLTVIDSLQIKLTFPGHGGLIEDSHSLIHKRLNSIAEKSKRIITLIESGINTGSELAQAIYKKRYQDQFSLVMSEIIGQLDYLEKEGRLERDLKNGVWHYYVAPCALF